MDTGLSAHGKRIHPQIMTAARLLTAQPPVHGNCDLPDVCVQSYSLETRDRHGFVGDSASQTAFREMLAHFWKRVQPDGRFDPSLGNAQLDRLLRDGESREAQAIVLATDEFAHRLAYVIERFTAQAAWSMVERIAIGGGFKESAVGRLAVRRTVDRLAERGNPVSLRLLHHHADAAGLIGWAQMLPARWRETSKRFLAIDIGGTNVRCGVVGLPGPERSQEPILLDVEKRKHADSGESQVDLVEGIVDSLRRLIDRADRSLLLPFVGIGCPGHIRADGSIERGAQNLPGDWESASFHLPRRLTENIPSIQGEPTVVVMHNDAVLQGLSEAPRMRDVRHWGVLTIGTGLGNATFANRAPVPMHS